MKIQKKFSSEILFVFFLFVLITSCFFTKNVIAGMNIGLNKKITHIKIPFLLPDLVITNIEIVPDVNMPDKGRVRITIENRGGPIPINQFNLAVISLKDDRRTIGDYSLKMIDTNKNLTRAHGKVSFIWGAMLLNPGTYKFGAYVDPTNKIRESNERNNDYSWKTFRFQGPLPDLVVKDVKLVQGCKLQVTLANIGRGHLNRSAYNAPIQMYNDGKPWGGMILKVADPNHVLQNPGSQISFLWFPNASNLAITPGQHQIKLELDGRNIVSEANEQNNVFIKTIRCGKPDLGLYGFLKIGKYNKVVRWNETIVLTPADGSCISTVNCMQMSLPIKYAFREYNKIAADNFKNKIFQNNSLRATQEIPHINPFEIQYKSPSIMVNTTENGRLCIKIDADNQVVESSENNNFGCINIKFDRIQNGVPGVNP